MNVRVVGLRTVTPGAGEPATVTVAPGWKSLPVIVTVVPPMTGPLLGAIPTMLGLLTPVSTTSFPSPPL